MAAKKKKKAGNVAKQKASKKRQSVKAECSDCGGTGVYCGFIERKGEGVVCLSCSGTGCKTISYVPFSGRKQKRGVKTVSLSKGSFILTGVGPIRKTEVSYQDFLAGKLKAD